MVASKWTQSITRLASSAPHFSLLCDRPLPHLPSTEKLRVRRKPLPTFDDHEFRYGSSSLKEHSLGSWEVEGSDISNREARINREMLLPRSLLRQTMINDIGMETSPDSPKLGKLATSSDTSLFPGPTTDTFRRFSMTELEQRFEELCEHLGPVEASRTGGEMQQNEQDTESFHSLDETRTVRRPESTTLWDLVDLDSNTVGHSFLGEVVSLENDFEGPDMFYSEGIQLLDPSSLSTTSIRQISCQPSNQGIIADPSCLEDWPLAHSAHASRASTTAPQVAYIPAGEQLVDEAAPQFFPSGRSFEPVRAQRYLCLPKWATSSKTGQTPLKPTHRPVGGKIKAAIEELESDVVGGFDADRN